MRAETIKKILACIAIYIVIGWVAFFGGEIEFMLIDIPLFTLMVAVAEGDVKI